MPDQNHSCPVERSALPPGLPGNRRFGLFFAAVLCGMAAYGGFAGWRAASIAAALIASALMAFAAVKRPYLLASLNRYWFRLGELLGKVVSPLLLGVIFYGMLTPTALVTRAFGRDPLKLRRRAAATYWADRHPPGPTHESFRNQY